MVLELGEQRLVLGDVAIAVEVEAEEQLKRLSGRIVEELLSGVDGPIGSRVSHVQGEGVEADVDRTIYV